MNDEEILEKAMNQINAEAKISEFAAEVAELLGKAEVVDGSPDEVLERVEQWCYDASSNALDELQQKMQVQQEMIEDVKTQLCAVSVARTSAGEESLDEESMTEFSGLYDAEVMDGLMEGIESHDAQMADTEEQLTADKNGKPALEDSADILHDKDIALANELFTMLEGVPCEDSGLCEMISELGELCGRAGEIAGEIEIVGPC